MDKKTAAEIVSRLETVYPRAVCALEADGDPWRLLVMGRLSAQCTDARVNIVCQELFRRFPDARSMAECDIAELEEIVKPCGLFHVKAQNLKDASRMLVDDYGGILPDDMESLLKFPGVGRKIANLLLGDVFGKPAIVADTHCIRICGRLGFYPESLKDPLKVERILSGVIEPEKQSDFCHRLVNFGRDICSARAPVCAAAAQKTKESLHEMKCPLAELCAHYRGNVIS